MSNTLLLKRSGVANSAPTAGSLALGELAINYLDGNLFYKDTGGNIKVIASNQTITLTGNVVSGNLNAAGLSLSGNVVSALNVTPNIAGGNISTPGIVSAAGNITSSGNVSGNYILGNITFATGYNTTKIFNGTSEANIGVSGGNANISIGGTSNVAVFATTGAYIGGVVSATGNITGGNLNAAGLSLSGNVVSALNASSSIAAGTTINAVGNITGGNLNAAGLSLSGNVVSALNASSSIAAGTTINAVGNITGGNINTAGAVSASGNITGGNVNTNTISGTGTTIRSNGALNLSATGNIIVNNVAINGVATPMQDADAANKGYVDSVAQGLDVKASVNYATAAALPAYTYNNGTDGIGATITINATGTLTIDGQVTALNDRILVKNETLTNAPYNGIYYVSTAGATGVAAVLTRALDFNTAAEMYSAFTFVEYGTGLADTGWVCTNNSSSPITVGTTAITFSQFSGAGSYTAGTGLTLTGTEFSVNASQTQITAVGTLGSLAVTGNTSSGNLLTGGLISATGNITGGNILGGANVNATTHTGATVSVSGNITGGNVNTAGLISASGNIIGGNITFGSGIVSGTGNIQAGNINADNGIYINSVSVLTTNSTVDGGTY